VQRILSTRIAARGEAFVTKKITVAAARIKTAAKDFTSANLDSSGTGDMPREYVEGMWLMLQQDVADDYVLAYDETHSIRDFLGLLSDASA